MEDYFVKNTVSLKISADHYEVKIDLKDQQRSLYIYKTKRAKSITGFFFDLIIFNDVTESDEKMTLRLEINNFESNLILWKDDHRMRIESIMFNNKERIHWIINDVIYKIDTWIMEEHTQESLKRMILGLE